ncbi:hypothetical protein ABPG77_004965 [Micractinium sp. CCAP 211/92]
MQALPVKARVVMIRGDEAKQREDGNLHPARASPKPPPAFKRPESPPKRASSLSAAPVNLTATPADILPTLDALEGAADVEQPQSLALSAA